MVLYGLLVPLFILLIGAGLDLGWYYLNVSRLQNAADAAVVAGTHALVDDINAKNSAAKISVTYNYDGTITDKYSADYLSDADTSVGDEVAANYALKNLSADADWTKAQDVKAYTLSDDWSREEASEVTLMPFLYESGENIYYVVHLTEKVEHLFLPGFFDAMDAPVVAVAMLTKTTGTVAAKKVNIVFDANGGNFDDRTDETSREFKAAESMEDDETSEPLYSGKGKPSNSIQKEFKGWSTTQNPKEGDKIVIYEDGKQLNKNEVAALFGDKDTVTLYAVWKEVLPMNNRTLWEQMHYLIAKNVYDPDWDVSVQKYGKVGETAKIVHNSFDDINNTYIYNYHYYTERINLETAVTNSSNVGNETRYFIDFRRNDWLSVYRSWYYSTANARVHSLFNVNKAYDVRSGYNDDPLYIRIEAEPGKDGQSSETAYYATPIRQIVININADNTADSKRPLFFYYDGPDKVKSDNAAPQPVILNLNADFKGVLFMPDVPVVINGNGHKFEGFIVAKEFRYLNRRSGTRVKYSSDGKTVTNASDNLIRVNPSTGDVYSVLADGDDALAIFTNNEDRDKFNLNSASQFRTFKAQVGVNYMYIFYDFKCQLDPSPFYLNTGDLVQLYKLVNGKQVRVTKWEDVKLYDAPLTDSTRKEIPKDLPYNDQNKGIVLLDSDGNPAPVYDEAGNPIYFCEDYVNLTGVYTVFTLDRVVDGTRDPKEFLLPTTVIDPKTYEEKILTNTDDWK
ncbi:MAG: Tad domain-containing protein [Selenomonadaceae bacterium]|nr:Tad domain-containing protein [Selenomonadaceae bacterium]